MSGLVGKGVTTFQFAINECKKMRGSILQVKKEINSFHFIMPIKPFQINVTSETETRELLNNIYNELRFKKKHQYKDVSLAHFSVLLHDYEINKTVRKVLNENVKTVKDLGYIYMEMARGSYRRDISIDFAFFCLSVNDFETTQNVLKRETQSPESITAETQTKLIKCWIILLTHAMHYNSIYYCRYWGSKLCSINTSQDIKEEIVHVIFRQLKRMPINSIIDFNLFIEFFPWVLKMVSDHFNVDPFYLTNVANDCKRKATVCATIIRKSKSRRPIPCNSHLLLKVV